MLSEGSMTLDMATLEAAANRLEQLHGNKVYMAAWKRAAKIIRRMSTPTENTKNETALSK